MSNHLASWIALQQHAAINFKDNKNPSLHLRTLLQDEARANDMRMEFDGTLFDFSRSRATRETKSLWFDLAREAKVSDKIQGMAKGEIMNATEKRQVLHAALRCSRDSKRFASDIVKSVSWDLFGMLQKYLTSLCYLGLASIGPGILICRIGTERFSCGSNREAN